MKTQKMILYWNGFIPIQAELPLDEIIWDKVECYMDSVRKIGLLKQSNVKLPKV